MGVHWNIRSHLVLNIYEGTNCMQVIGKTEIETRSNFKVSPPPHIQRVLGAAGGLLQENGFKKSLESFLELKLPIRQLNSCRWKGAAILKSRSIRYR